MIEHVTKIKTLNELIDPPLDHTEPLATEEECKAWCEAHPGEEMPEWIHKWFREVAIPEQTIRLKKWKLFMDTICED